MYVSSSSSSGGTLIITVSTRTSRLLYISNYTFEWSLQGRCVRSQGLFDCPARSRTSCTRSSTSTVLQRLEGIVAPATILRSVLSLLWRTYFLRTWLFPRDLGKLVRVLEPEGSS